MEHVAKPWLAAKNIEDILQDGGLLIWTTPGCGEYTVIPTTTGDFRRMG